VEVRRDDGEHACVEYRTDRVLHRNHRADAPSRPAICLRRETARLRNHTKNGAGSSAASHCISRTPRTDLAHSETVRPPLRMADTEATTSSSSIHLRPGWSAEGGTR